MYIYFAAIHQEVDVTYLSTIWIIENTKRDSSASMESTRSEQNETVSLDSNPGDSSETDFVMFETPGLTDDEITLTFEDKTNLYASRGFLMQTSPVFRAMLAKDRFKESEEMEVKITDFNRRDMLEFLSCCNPGQMKHVNGKLLSQTIYVLKVIVSCLC